MSQPATEVISEPPSEAIPTPARQLGESESSEVTRPRERAVAADHAPQPAAAQPDALQPPTDVRGTESMVVKHERVASEDVKRLLQETPIAREARGATARMRDPLVPSAENTRKGLTSRQLWHFQSSCCSAACIEEDCAK